MAQNKNQMWWYIVLFFILLNAFPRGSFFILIVGGLVVYLFYTQPKFRKKVACMYKSKQSETTHKTYEASDDATSAKSNKSKINFSGMETFETISKKGKRFAFSIVLVILAIILLVNMVIVVPAGMTGVYHLFGKVRDTELSSGIHLVNPLAVITPMSIRTEEYTMSVAAGEGQRLGDDSITALTKEGLSVGLDVTVLYRLNEADADDVYRDLGTNYDEKIIRPVIRSVIREVVSGYEAKDIYSERRAEVTTKLDTELATRIQERGITIENVLLRNVHLPPKLAQSIEEKLSAEQESQRYDFVLEKEEKEAERKRIEAAGQRDAQNIINESLTDRYLQYLYVNGLENRAGTIYVPTGNDGLPLFKSIQ